MPLEDVVCTSLVAPPRSPSRSSATTSWTPATPVAISTRPYPIPSRTRKSSSSEPMVLQE
jgi:hypothetical protein